MNRSPAIFFLTSLVLSSHAWSGKHTASVHSVKDGDTLVATINGKQEQLQLLGIDAPEDVPNPKLQKDMERTKLKQDALIAIGKLATKHLKTLAVPGQTIEVDANLAKRDRYGRVPAVVKSASGRQLNGAMVEDGYAVVMGRYPFDATLKVKLQQQQQNAISKTVGLWGSHRAIVKAWSGK